MDNEHIGLEPHGPTETQGAGHTERNRRHMFFFTQLGCNYIGVKVKATSLHNGLQTNFQVKSLLLQCKHTTEKSRYPFQATLISLQCNCSLKQQTNKSTAKSHLLSVSSSTELLRFGPCTSLWNIQQFSISFTQIFLLFDNFQFYIHVLSWPSDIIQLLLPY